MAEQSPQAQPTGAAPAPETVPVSLASDAVEAAASPTDASQTAPEPEPGETSFAGAQELEANEAEDVELTPEQLRELRESEVAFSWQASEYVHHEKDGMWYAGLFGAVIALVLLMALLRSWVAMVMFVFMGVAVMIYARKPPRTLTYELTPTAVTIEGKAYPYTEFRSFGVLPDVSWHTIDLEPRKRFSPRLAILFDEADYDSIVGHLELHLPRVDRKPDFIELASRYLRF